MVKKSLLVAGAALILSTASIAVPSVVYAADARSSSSHASESISLPVTSDGKGRVGSEKVMSSHNVPNGSYTVHVKSMNQESVHPGTDMIVRSNGDQVEVKDVESRAFKEATATGTLEVTEGKVSLVVRIGKDGAFSGGMKVTLTKVKPTPVTPEAPVEPQKPEKPEKPEQPVEPTEPETPVAPETPEKPETPAKPVKADVPKEIPSTGPGAILSALVGTSALAGATHAYLRSRRNINL